MALYHQYRPQQFSDVVGQTAIVQTLQNQIINGTYAHAYLFSGPRGVGKTSIARIMAKAITCPRPDDKSAEPDNTSQCAIDITASRSVDVIEIDAASHTGVDHVREHIIEQARFHPSVLSHKIFIIDEVHMLSNSAFNALLKTLEEPPKHVIFILATTELHKVPATIISRCQRFQFHKVAKPAMSEYIESVAKKEKIKVDPEVIDRVVHVSDGCVRDAMSLLEQVLATGDKHITVADIANILPHTDVDAAMTVLTPLLQQDLTQTLAAIQALGDDGEYMETVFDQLAVVLRDGLVTKVTANDDVKLSDLHEETLGTIHDLMSTYRDTDMVALLDILLQRKRQITTAPRPDMPLQMVAIAWHGRGEQPAAPVAPPTATTPPKPQPTTTPPAPKKDTPPPVVETVVEEPAVATPASTTPPVKATPTNAVEHVNKKAVLDRWPQCLAEIEKTSPSLIFILKSATVADASDDGLVLAVPFAFHQDKLLDTSCKQVIEAALLTVLGKELHLAVVVEAADKQQQDPGVADLAAAFGGEVM